MNYWIMPGIPTRFFDNYNNLRRWRYSKVAYTEMYLLDKANRPYPKIIPESWKEYY